jgi:hypothetical protein
VTNLYDRLIVGAQRAPMLHGAEFNAWVGDLDVFTARCERHEFTQEQARQVIKAVRDSELNRVMELDALVAAAASYHAIGPAHLLALEHQWLALKVNSALLRQIHGASTTHALQVALIEALKVADAYCWSPETVEAVASVAAGLPDDCAMSATALGDLALPGTTGWWWFQRPVPIATTTRGADKQPVQALIWRRRGPPGVWPSRVVDDVGARAAGSGRPCPQCLQPDDRLRVAGTAARWPI